MSESALGKADSSTEDAGKEFSCPTCGRVFESDLGLKQHHARTHGESLAKRETTCDNCGSDIVVKEHNEDQEHHFCDRVCSAEFQKNREQKTCEICGEQYEVIQFRAEESKYCSSECRVEGTKRITGDERYNYRTDEYECVECGENVERSPSMVYSEDRVFCGDKCYNEHQRNGYEQYYGRNWNRKRRQALRRDQYRCVVCGDTPQDLYREPDVHHLKPIEYFKNNYSEPEWWRRGNRLRNLVTMCPSCHRKWEGIPVKPKPIRNY